MKRIIGIGETVTDILLHHEKAERAVPGGSAFNAMVSLGRCGLHPYFIGEVGDDYLGERTRRFMLENGMNDHYLSVRKGCKTQLSLAFIDNEGEAHYSFYKDHTGDCLPYPMPRCEQEDVVVLGSYFSINPLVHADLSHYLEGIAKAGGIVYYDVNFRSSHLAELNQVKPNIMRNIALSTIVRCSSEDFRLVFGEEYGKDYANFYHRIIEPNGGVLLITCGAASTQVYAPHFESTYPVRQLHPISTVGAGDSFNAGFVYSIIAQRLSADDFLALSSAVWMQLIQSAIDFSSEVCLSTENYISQATGNSLKFS